MWTLVQPRVLECSSVCTSGFLSFLTELLSPSRSRVEIGLIAPFALDALQHLPTASTGAETTAVRQPFIVSSQQYMAHGGVAEQQRPLRPLEVRAQGRKLWWRVHGMLYYHPYILRGTRALLPHTTHMIYCCNHQTHSRTLAVVSCPYEPVCRNYRRPNPHFVHITHFCRVL